MNLLPSKNFRRLFQRRACSNCKYWMDDPRYNLKWHYLCIRPDHSILGDWMDNEPEFHVCDRHAWRDPKGE